MDLRLCWIEHVREYLSAYVKDHANDRDKQNQNPSHRSGTENVIRRQCEARELIRTFETNKLIYRNANQIKENREKSNPNPSVRQSTEEAFANPFSECEWRPFSVNQRSAFKEDLFMQ